MGKSLTSNYVKKLLDSTKESATLETKTSSKRYIKRQKQKVIQLEIKWHKKLKILPQRLPMRIQANCLYK